MSDSYASRDTWAAYTSWLAEHHPALFAKLNGPTPEADFAAFEAVTGMDFPFELATIYRQNNGGEAFGFNLLSVGEIISEWQVWKDLIDDEDNDDLGEFATSSPEGAIHLDYGNANWIPFLGDWGGNYIGIDLDPDDEGEEGQIINFGRDEDEKYVFANNLDEFLSMLWGWIQRGDFTITDHVEVDGTTEPVFNFTGGEHLIDILKDRYEKGQLA